jgi:hypothetical protein
VVAQPAKAATASRPEASRGAFMSVGVRGFMLIAKSCLPVVRLKRAELNSIQWNSLQAG